jgi:thiol-disulfide isomerase/thioredoxin
MKRRCYSLINFYFAQCGPCIKEVPDLNALAKSRGDMNFIGVTFDTADETRQFAADTKFNWTLLPASIKLINELGVRAYPTFALVDPKGALVAISVHDAIIEKDKSIAAWVERTAPRAK